MIRIRLRNKFLRLMLLLALSLLLAGCPLAGGISTRELIPASEAEPAPNFSLPDLAGNTVNLSDYFGKVVLLNFWATWCPPCRREIPLLVELQSDYSPQGFCIIGISLDTTGRGGVREFAQDYGINYPVVMADDQVIEDYGGMTYIPTTFLIDRKQRVRMKVVGAADKQVFEEAVKQLLNE